MEEKSTETLEKIIDGIETVNLKDRDGWKVIRTDLGELVSQVSPETPAVEPLTLCLEGIRCLSEESVVSPLSLVDAVSETLYAFQKYLAGEDVEGLMEQPGRELANVLRGLAETREEKGDAKADSERPSDFSLNDAAARLVLLEADDLDELGDFKGLLETLSDGVLPEATKERLCTAVNKINGIIEGTVSDVDGTVEEIGALLEEAIDIMDEDGLESSPDASDAMVDATSDVDSEVNVQAEAAVPSEPEPEEKTKAETVHSESLPEDADLDLMSEFVAESTDLISDAEESLLTLETDPDDVEAVGTVFRAFHTVKGVAAFLELTAISEMAHHAESLLSRVRDKEIRYAGGYADLALRALDMIKQMITAVQDALGGAPLQRPEGYEDLMDLLRDPEGAGISDESAMEEAITPRLGDILVAEGKVDREQVEVLASAQSGKPIGVEMVKTKTATVEAVAQGLRTQERMKGKQVFESSVRVSTSRLDRLIDMVGELVIAQSMVAQDEVVVSGSQHQLLKKVNQTGKIVRELQNLGMSMRMIPLKGTFKKMTRLVRDLSRKMGKNVRLVTHGEDTEIDRNMVDVINDPLMHMVRNAVDHGIETADVREAAGKPGFGTVKLSAYHAAGSVVVEIEDDGKGIPRDVILAKAKEKGLISDGSALSDREVFNLIFEPGFSTAAVVSDVSGRGVGMDVVKKNIDSIRGQVEIQSEWGKGSVFKMRLPLTLAIIDGMALRVNKETYIIPTGSIIRSIKPEPESLSTVLNKGEMLSLQGQLIPLFRLHKLFSIEHNDENQDKQLVVVVEDDNKRQAGLIIDELIGRQQIVIKTLGDAMRNIPGISGGAIMPNGQVGLILDVGGVVQLANSNNGGV